jgi:hypothetical protein
MEHIHEPLKPLLGMRNYDQVHSLKYGSEGGWPTQLVGHP